MISFPTTGVLACVISLRNFGQTLVRNLNRPKVLVCNVLCIFTMTCIHSGYGCPKTIFPSMVPDQIKVPTFQKFCRREGHHQKWKRSSPIRILRFKQFDAGININVFLFLLCTYYLVDCRTRPIRIICG